MGPAVKILATEQDLRACLSADETGAYLGSGWRDQNTAMVRDKVIMTLKAPFHGQVDIEGAYQPGADHYVIKVSSSLSDLHEPDTRHRHQVTVLGDAHSGIIIALLAEGDDAVQEIAVIDWPGIQDRLHRIGPQRVYQLQKDGFAAYSRGDVTLPDVLYMPFEDRQGDLHLKGAHRNGGDIFVLKIATGFYGNPARGVSSHQGVMLAFNARTGAPVMVLKDEGHLTDLRTAIAGRNAAEEMMRPEDLVGIGVLGAGVQARLQIELMEDLYPDCRRLAVWGRTPSHVQKYADEMTARGWQVAIAPSPNAVAEQANLVIAATPTKTPLLDVADIKFANTLIISIGADMPGKVELSPALLKAAANVVIDSITQGQDHGNAAGALKSGIISTADLQEFGDVVSAGLRYGDQAKALRLFLSSGIGVQDLQIVEAVIAGSSEAAK